MLCGYNNQNQDISLNGKAYNNIQLQFFFFCYLLIKFFLEFFSVFFVTFLYISTIFSFSFFYFLYFNSQLIISTLINASFFCSCFPLFVLHLILSHLYPYFHFHQFCSFYFHFLFSFNHRQPFRFQRYWLGLKL